MGPVTQPHAPTLTTHSASIPSFEIALFPFIMKIIIGFGRDFRIDTEFLQISFVALVLIFAFLMR